MQVDTFIIDLLGSNILALAFFGIGAITSLILISGWAVGLFQIAILKQDPFWKRKIGFATTKDVTDLKKELKEIKEEQKEIKTEQKSMSEEFHEVLGYIRARKEARGWENN